MKKEWLEIICAIQDDPDNLPVCPLCASKSMDFQFVEYKESGMGSLAVWCNCCFKGIWVSRCKVPQNLKLLSFDDDLSDRIPNFERVSIN